MSFIDTIAEFERQHQADAASADRALLERGREQLAALEEAGRLDSATARAGHTLLLRCGEPQALVNLLSRYLNQDLSPEEEAWARWNRIDTLAEMPGRGTETVALQQDFLDWTHRVYTGRRCTLGRGYPHLPVTDEASDVWEDALLFAIYDAAHGLCWVEAGRGYEWLSHHRAAMAQAQVSAATRGPRFSCLRSACFLQAKMGGLEEALRTADGIQEIAEEDPSWEGAFRLRTQAIILKMRACGIAEDGSRVRALGSEAITLIESYERQRQPLTEADKKPLRSLCHDTAAPLRGLGHYDLAIPLFRRALAYGMRRNPWTYVWLAAALWKTTGEKREPLALLQRAAQECSGHDLYAGETLWDKCCRLPEFTAVADDPDFRAAAATPDRQAD